MAKSKGLGWVIPTLGIAALLFGLLISGLALRLQLSEPFPLPPVGSVEGVIESPDSVQSPAGPQIATAAVELSAYAKPEGQTNKRTFKLWLREPNPVTVKTAAGPVDIKPPKDLAGWIDVKTEEVSFPSLKGVPMVSATTQWRKFDGDGNFTVKIKSAKSGDHVFFDPGKTEADERQAPRLWIGTAADIAESQELQRADPPWPGGIGLTVVGIGMILFTFRGSLLGRKRG